MKIIAPDLPESTGYLYLNHFYGGLLKRYINTAYLKPEYTIYGER